MCLRVICEFFVRKFINSRNIYYFMGLIDSIKKPFVMLKAYREFSKIQSANYRSENSKVLTDEDREASLQTRQLNAEKRKLQRRKEFLLRQAEIDEIAEEVAELETEIYGEEEEEDKNFDFRNMKPEEMLMNNLMNVFNNNSKTPPQTNINKGYPTGTTDNQPAQPERKFSDEDLKHYSNYLTPEQKNVIKQIPQTDLLRIQELLNQ